MPRTDTTNRTPPRRRTRSRRLADAALALDPGLVKTDGALRTLVAVPAGMAVGYAVATAFGLPAILGVMIGAMPAFITCLVIVDPSTGRTAARTGAVLVPFVVALAGSIALQPFRLLELVLIVVLLFLQFAAAAWGAWAADAAIVGFAGYLCGLLLPLPETSVVPLGLVVAASLAATILVRLVLRPDAHRTLLRTRRGFVARGSAVLEAAAAVLAAADDPSARRRTLRRLRRSRDRYHEIALTVDGMLAASGVDADTTAEELHRLVFDTHFAVDELGRGAGALVEHGAPSDVRHAALRAVTIVLRHGGGHGEDAAQTLLARYGITASAGDPGSRTTAVVRRMAAEFTDLQGAGLRWRELRDELPHRGDGVALAAPFVTPVVLAGGRPAGAVPVLADTVADGPWRRWRLSVSLRTAVHAAIAVAIVEPLALLLDGPRFYWGVIGVMIVLAGTNTTHERVRKGLHRAVGTVVGGAVGIVLVHVVGTAHPWFTLVLVCVLLAVGTYGFGGVYSVWVACLVVVLCQVYAFSGSFTDSLIPIRLAENLLGAAVAVVVSAVVFPIATRAVIRRAVRRQLTAVRAFVLALVGVDADAEADATDGAGAIRASRSADTATDAAAPDLRARSRAVDAATYQLDAVLRPMVRFPTGGSARADARTRTSLQAAATFAREAAGRLGSPPQDPPAALVGAAHRLAASIADLADGIVAGPRSAAPAPVWARVGDQLDTAVGAAAGGPDQQTVEVAAHALGRIDEALALLADRHRATVLGETATRSAATGAR